MSHRYHPREVVVLTIVNATNHVYQSTSSRHAPEFSAGTLARKAYLELLMDGFHQEAEFQGNVYTVIGFVKDRHDRYSDLEVAEAALADED